MHTDASMMQETLVAIQLG